METCIPRRQNAGPVFRRGEYKSAFKESSSNSMLYITDVAITVTKSISTTISKLNMHRTENLLHVIWNEYGFLVGTCDSLVFAEEKYSEKQNISLKSKL